MNGTPRLRSAFPSTPQKKVPNNSASDGRSPNGPGVSSPWTRTVAEPEDPNAPVIPFTLIDAPTQRLYAFAIYVALHAWRFYDYFSLLQDDVDSLWLFLKWAAIDGVFIYGLPGMKVPWLEWSNVTTTVLFLIHAVLDGILMFRVPIPIEAWLVGFARIVYDRELSVSERRVNPADILRNSSHILGKQIIHILPEGSAALNPEALPFCLDSSKTSASIPIHINQTTPILIELLRVDLETNQNETIPIPTKQIRALKKQAEKSLSKQDTTSPRVLQFPIKRTGLYRLQKVVDESNLEVQRRMSDTLVVECPRASVASVDNNRCRGELSNLALDVYGTPPLKIKYSRSVNQMDSGFFFQSIQPENLISPLIGHRSTGALASRDDIDVSWAQSHHVRVPLNETLNTYGSWRYSIDEVHDACGNVANYSSLRNDDGERLPTKGVSLDQHFNVRERPVARLPSSTSRHTLKVARGESVRFPVSIESQGRGQIDPPYRIAYQFTPMADMPPSGEHGVNSEIEEREVTDLRNDPAIKSPGLYTLKSISSRFCSGEVLEPTSALLENPPEPDVIISTENIYDRCAGNSIGLQVDLDLIGTPPFKLFYEIQQRGSKHTVQKTIRIPSLRHQLELRPEEAGHYSYRFRVLTDEIYGPQSLTSKNLVLEQDVKPPASAHFVTRDPSTTVCIEKGAEFDIRLQGEKPWTIEYEIVHRGKRTKRKVKDIEGDRYSLATEPLMTGGEYGLALISVQDKTGCKIFLNEEAQINVRPSKPKASFGLIEGTRTALTLEGKRVNLPVKLTGEGPWSLSYRNLESSTVSIARLHDKNDKIEVSHKGTYELSAVEDDLCEGAIDETAKEFEVQWIPRPKIGVPDYAVASRKGEKILKKDVCEGDEDAVEVNLTGTPPYNVKYEQRHFPQKGSTSLSIKEFSAGLGRASITMDTSKAGLVEYKFSELDDNLYNHDPRKHEPLVIQQRVNPKPTARFATPGKTYKYCKDHNAGGEVIPIALQGVPPFHLDIGIKPHSSTKPETVRVPNIESNTYEFRVPSRLLTLGNHVVSIRKVHDANGCQRKWDFDAPHVPVTVADPPSISPLDSRVDFCVGDRISYLLSGTQPFNIFYNFEGADRKATSSSTNFRRIAEKPGNFTITAVTDRNSDCKASTKLTKLIHELPSVRISKGRTLEVDIHEGGEAEILFEFWGTPPFEFTYTRSTTVRKGKKAQILETKHEVSYDHTKTVRASEEGTYEVVAIKDQFCSYSMHKQSGNNKQSQKLLQL
ncbi:MAG: hypothetical protein M4579_005471 [Chaenotheca gracillima]|nr:MAG: hypothetical protein M4579_005471 [Chaenotheca gracillima]